MHHVENATVYVLLFDNETTCTCFNLQSVKEMLTQVVQSAANQYESASVATSGKSGIRQHSYSFSSCIVLQ